jgi:hypothetical protein
VPWNETTFGGDTLFPFNPDLNLRRIFEMWDPANFGRPSLYPALPCYFGWFWLGAKAGFSAGLSAHILSYLYTVAAGFCAGLLAYEVAPSELGEKRKGCAAFATATYLLLPPMLHLPIGWAMAGAIPLALYSLIRALRAATRHGVLGYGLIGGLSYLLMLNDVPNYEMQAVLALWYGAVLCAMLLHRASRRVRSVKAVAYYSVALGVLAPLLLGLTLQVMPLYSRSVAITPVHVGTAGAWGDEGGTLLANVLSLLSYAPADYKSLPVALCALVPAALFVVAWSVRGELIGAVAAATVVSALLTVGPNPPMRPIYEWLVALPGGLAFRTVGKLHLFVALGYAVLAPIGLDRLTQIARAALTPRFERERLATVLAAGYGVVLAVVGWPIWTGTTFEVVGNPDHLVQRLPPIFLEAGEYVRAHPGRTLLIPELGYITETFETRRYFGPAPEVFTFPGDLVSQRTGMYGQPADPFATAIYNDLDAAALQVPWTLFDNAHPPERASLTVPGDRLTFSTNAGAAIWKLAPGSRTHRLSFPPKEHWPADWRARWEDAANFEIYGQVETGSAPGDGWYGALDGRRRSLTRPIQPYADAGTGTARPFSGVEFHGDLTALARVRPFLEWRLPDDDSRGELTLRNLFFRKALGDDFYRRLIRSSIRYVFVDGAADGDEASGTAQLLAGDPHFTPLMHDEHGRVLYEFPQAEPPVTFCPKPGPCGAPDLPAPGLNAFAFRADRGGTFLFNNAYSPLWRYTAFDIATRRTTVLRSQQNTDGFGTSVALPARGDYVIRYEYLPQRFLTAQWILWSLILAAAGVWGIVRLRDAHRAGRLLPAAVASAQACAIFASLLLAAGAPAPASYAFMLAAALASFAL